MRRLGFGLLLALLGACAATPAQMDGQLSLSEAAVILLSRKSVQKELKLTAAQVKAIEGEFKTYGEKVRAIAEKGRPGTTQQAQARERDLNRERTAFTNRALNRLQPAQRDRLRQLGAQFYGPFALLAPDVAKEVGLTADQSKRMRAEQDSLKKTVIDIQKKRVAELQSVPQPKDANDKKAVEAYQRRIAEMIKRFDAADRATLDRAKKSAESRVLAMLSPVQRTKWAAMQGAKFTFTGNA
jgi:hypothetical protein